MNNIINNNIDNIDNVDNNDNNKIITINNMNK